jgi:hypothetical protein
MQMVLESRVTPLRGVWWQAVLNMLSWLDGLSPRTVRWKAGSNSCTSRSHSDDAHSTELCCKKSNSLRGAVQQWEHNLKLHFKQGPQGTAAC